MGDKEFDPCECTIFSHEWAMRRLLSLLRQSQTYCTDNECLNELPGSFSRSNEQSFMMLALCWMILGMVLYYFRPSTLRSRGGKREDNGPGSNGNSPSAPPLC